MSRISLYVGVFTVSFVAVASSSTLSSNLDAAVSYTELVGGNVWISAGFSTNATYTLSSATLLMEQNAQGVSYLDLYSDVSDAPGALLGTLRSPTNVSALLTPTVFSGSSLTLLADERYWLVLHANPGQYEWAYTGDNAGYGAGFLGNWGISNDAGRSWETSGTGPMIMEVNATPKDIVTPEPSTLAFLALAAISLSTVCFCCRNRNTTFGLSPHDERPLG